jgi:tripartite-type tricarboxylate transporter receptor subunit TctC
MDVIARVLGEQLSRDLRQPVVVDNKPGAGGGIGVQALLSAPADGQSFMVTASNVLTEIPLVMKTGFDPLKDLRPIYAVALMRNILVSNPNIPAQDFPSLVAYLKATPGKYSYASHSPGTTSHYAGLYLAQNAGLDLQHVPFAGAPPALAQVMGGQVTIMFDAVASSAPLIASGKLRAYGVGGSSRHPRLPQVPTFVELGHPELDYANWFGVVVSSKVPPQVADRLHRAIEKAADAQAVRDRIVDLGFEVVPSQGIGQLAQSVRTDYERNAAIVKKFNITP